MDFKAIETKGSGLFVDGKPVPGAIPAVRLELDGSLVMQGDEYLAFVDARGTPWSMAEYRATTTHLVRVGVDGRGWRTPDQSETIPRLPDLLRGALAATATSGPGSDAAQWFAVNSSVPLGPGLLWGDVALTPSIRDLTGAFTVGADAHGLPIQAHLWEAWHNGTDPATYVDETVSADFTFSTLGSAPPLPPVVPSAAQQRIAGLHLTIARPTDWVGAAQAHGRYEIQSTKERDSIVIMRGMRPDITIDQAAQGDAKDAKAGWHVPAEAIDALEIGGQSGRLLTFHPVFSGIPAFACDAIVFTAKSLYLFEWESPAGNDLGDRYLFERFLESVKLGP